MNKPAGSLTRENPPAAVSLVSYFSFQSPSADENSQKQADDLGAQFTEMFIQDPEHVTLLLALLEVRKCVCSTGKTFVITFVDNSCLMYSCLVILGV